MTTFDTVLTKFISPLGFWQWMTFILINLTIFGNHSSFPQLASLIPNHHCAIPSLEEAGLSYDEIRRLAIPTLKGSNNDGNSSHQYEKCYQYAVTVTQDYNITRNIQIVNDSIDRDQTVSCQNGWQYDSSTAPFRLSFSQQFDLVCKRQYYIPLSSSVYFFGSIVGRIVGGFLGDRFGRKPVMIGSCILTCILGIALALSPNIWVFCFIRFAVGIVSNAATLTSIVLWSEMTNDKHRNTFGFVFGIHESFVTPSAVVLVAYLFQDWRYQHIFMSVLYGLAVFHPCIITESPRWLLSTGRLKKGFKSIRWAIRLNGRSSKFSATEIHEMERDLTKHYVNDECSACKVPPPTSWRDNKIIALLTQSYLRRRMVPCLIVWIVIMGSSMGLQYYSVRMKHGNPYLVAFVGCTFTIPGLVMKQFLYHFFDRKRPLIGMFFIAAIICFVGAVLRASQVQGKWNSVLATIALGCVLVAQNMSYAVTAEAFPTVYRSYAMGLASGIGRVGAALSTFVERLDEYVWSGLPLTIFGVLSFVAAVTVYFIPAGDIDATEQDLQIESRSPSVDGSDEVQKIFNSKECIDNLEGPKIHDSKTEYGDHKDIEQVSEDEKDGGELKKLCSSSVEMNHIV